MAFSFIKHEADSPHYLRKLFEKEDHADNFLMGNIIVRRLEVFRTIEGKRRDETENREHSKYKLSDGIIDCQRTYINPVYILCLLGPECDLDKCHGTFGLHTVLIEDVNEFKRRLSNAWQLCEFSSGVAFYDVVYNKGEEIEAPPYLMSPHGTSLWQKRRDYNYENEYRFILECAMNPHYQFEDYLELKTGDIKDIARKEQRQ